MLTNSTNALRAGSVIAISVEHRSFLAERFNCRDVPLFTKACGLPEEPLPDVNDGVPDYQTNTAAVEAHVRMIIQTRPAIY